MSYLNLRRALVLSAAAIVTLVPLQAPASASTWPSKPKNVKVVAITSTTLTVTAHKDSKATSYRVYASPKISDLYRSVLTKKRPGKRSASSRSPKVTVKGLAYASGPLYYRYADVNGGHLQLTPTRTTYLRPPVPSNVTASDPAGPAYLTWSPGDVTGYQVRQVDLADPSAVVTSTLRGRAQSFTPPSTTPGHSYSVQVRAVNGSTRSTYSPAVTLGPVGQYTAPLTVISHNELSPNSTSYKNMATWSQRKAAMVDLYKNAGADIILAQEGGQFVSPGVRQVDTIAAALGSRWDVATTLLPGAPKAKSLSVYVVYDGARFAPVGDGTTIALPGLTASSPKYAAFQVLREIGTGAEFVVVSTHLLPGDTAKQRQVRIDELDKALDKAQQLSTAHGSIPIIFGGCLHEARTPNHPSDAPNSVLGGAGFADALVAAQSTSGGDLTSFNDYQRPIRKGVPIDRIFAGPGVAALSWQMLLHRSGNQLAGVIPSDHNPVATTVEIPVVPGH